MIELPSQTSCLSRICEHCLGNYDLKKAYVRMKIFVCRLAVIFKLNPLTADVHYIYGHVELTFSKSWTLRRVTRSTTTNASFLSKNSDLGTKRVMFIVYVKIVYSTFTFSILNV